MKSRGTSRGTEYVKYYSRKGVSPKAKGNLLESNSHPDSGQAPRSVGQPGGANYRVNSSEVILLFRITCGSAKFSSGVNLFTSSDAQYTEIRIFNVS